MSSKATLEDSLRKAILEKPDTILEDPGLMNALVAANERAMGSNIVDLRGIAMERLEARLDRLEDTHRSVIAAAYDNLAGTNQIHRAILRLMDPMDFESFLHVLSTEVAEILRVDAITLVLETAQGACDPAVKQLDGVLQLAEQGFSETYLTADPQKRTVTLRQLQDAAPRVYGRKAGWIHSEACLRLDFGEGRLPGLLVMGAEDPHQFTPQQGTDLLTFFAGVFERSMRHWLS
jgi:hypothetical protein